MAFAGLVSAPPGSAASVSGLAARSKPTFPFPLTCLATGCDQEQGAPCSLAELRTVNQQKIGENMVL